MQLYFTHQLVPKNDEPRPWGGPWGCAKCAKCAKMAKIRKMGKYWQKIMKKKEKILDISLEINATILHTPACTQK